jgi:heme/copper-type cytochrome/quinol oxidase subunit 4
MKCEYHPDREAVATCVVCGRQICDYCVAVMYGKKYCPHCFPIHPMPEPMGEDTKRAIKAAGTHKPKHAAILLMALCAVTYVPILVFMDTASAYFTALLVVTVISFALQISLFIRMTPWAWWGSTVTWFVDVIIVIVAQAYSADPSGYAAAAAVLFLGTPAGTLLLWGRVSKWVAITVPFYIMAVVALFLFLYAVYSNAPQW